MKNMKDIGPAQKTLIFKVGFSTVKLPFYNTVRSQKSLTMIAQVRISALDAPRTPRLLELSWENESIE